MASVFPTKELLEMIEERIFFGRILTTAALLLGLLAVIVGSCVFLYHAAILPTVNLVSTAITTGKINPLALGKAVFGFIFPGIIYWLLQWTHRGTSRLMKEVLDGSEDILKRNSEVLAVAKETNEHLVMMARTVEQLDARVAVLENKPPILPRRGQN